METRIVLLSLVIAFLGWVVIRVAAPAVGVCSTDGRRIDDQELMGIALRYQDDMDLRDAHSIADYLAKYPECCSVRRKSELTLTDKIFGERRDSYAGDFSVDVVVQQKTAGRQRYVTALISINGCGEVVEHYVMDRGSLENE